jgi:ketosteroid isomerase-like protein
MTVTITPAALDALVDDHFRAEIDGDLNRLLATFADSVEHDVVGNPDVSTGKEQVAAFYRGLLADLDRQATTSSSTRRW